MMILDDDIKEICGMAINVLNMVFIFTILINDFL